MYRQGFEPEAFLPKEIVLLFLVQDHLLVDEVCDSLNFFLLAYKVEPICSVRMRDCSSLCKKQIVRMKPGKLKQYQPKQSCDCVHVDCVQVLHCNPQHLYYRSLEFDRAFLEFEQDLID